MVTFKKYHALLNDRLICIPFSKHLTVPCQILLFVHFLLLLLYSCVFRRCDINQECSLVVLHYNYNIWSSVFNHVVRLDTDIYYYSYYYYYYLQYLLIRNFLFRETKTEKMP